MVKKNKGGAGKRKIIDKLRNFKQDVLTIPNLLTSIRIILVPVVLLFIWLDTPVMRLWSWIFYTVATVTDFFDGYLARKSGTVSVSGKLLDPLADKFIVNLTLVLLVSMQEISAWPVIIILAREFYIFGIRSLAMEHDLVIAADIWGKTKTMLQMFALPFFMINQKTLLALVNIDWDPSGVGYFLIWSSIVFSLISAFTYTREVKRKIFG
ncbi:CDP-diacylglycerol--glycerol-3-phosphate 3-phosphatidyltransferase [bacterium]|nr:CDP-diacylglycerol--glycerol-3-phosphate 3-phosphatidyltransferase [bacterium]